MLLFSDEISQSFGRAVPYFTGLQVYLDSTDASTITSAYQNLASTVTGTAGLSTLVCTGDETAGTRAGRQIQVNGVDVYTIASASTSVGVTTITVVGTLANSYAAKAIAVLRISQVSDKSGNGNHAIQGTAASQPALKASGINGKPSLNFSTNYMSITNNTGLVPGNAGITIFIVTRNNLDTGTDHNILRKWVNAGTLSYLINFTNNLSPDRITFGISSDGTNGLFTTPNQPSLSTSMLLEFKGRASTSTNSQFYVNKVSAGTNAGLAFASTSDILIGEGSATNFDISAILIYMRELTVSEDAQVNNFLYTEYGL